MYMVFSDRSVTAEETLSSFERITHFAVGYKMELEHLLRRNDKTERPT